MSSGSGAGYPRQRQEIGRYRTRRPAPAITTNVQRIIPEHEYAGMLRTMCGARPAIAPLVFEWMRVVNGVTTPVTGINSFVGRYARKEDEDQHRRHCRLLVEPGDVCIACCHIAGREHVRIIIYINENIWYPTPDMPVFRGGNWHTRIQSDLIAWVRLSRCGRIERAAQLALHEMQSEGAAYRKNYLRQWADNISADDYIAALQPFLRPIHPGPAQLQRQLISGLFSTWVEKMQRDYSVSIDTVYSSVMETLTNDTWHLMLTPEPNTSELSTENRQARGIKLNRKQQDGN